MNEETKIWMHGQNKQIQTLYFAELYSLVELTKMSIDMLGILTVLMSSTNFLSSFTVRVRM